LAEFYALHRKSWRFVDKDPPLDDRFSSLIGVVPRRIDTMPAGQHDRMRPDAACAAGELLILAVAMTMLVGKAALLLHVCLSRL
jgi:hypothetical protein